jgi:hypothetical protein
MVDVLDSDVLGRFCHHIPPGGMKTCGQDSKGAVLAA